MLLAFQFNILTELQLPKYSHFLKNCQFLEALTQSIFQIERLKSHQIKAYNEIFQTVLRSFMFYMKFRGQNLNLIFKFIIKFMYYITLFYIELNWIELHSCALHCIHVTYIKIQCVFYFPGQAGSIERINQQCMGMKMTQYDAIF